MTVTAPETTARLQIEAILTAEFGPGKDNIRVLSDKLDASLGNKGSIIGVSPTQTVANTRNRLMNDMQFLVQFYGRYTLEIKPTQIVDPAVIETYAERFRRAVKATKELGTSSVWYFDIDQVTWPDDPTGNKSRFEAIVTAHGNNSSLVESTG